MAKKRFKAEQVVLLLREAEAQLAKGADLLQVCRNLGFSTNSYYRWRKEYGGLRVDQAKRQPKRKRLWFNNGSCLRLRPNHPNHVWSYDFILDRTYDGRPMRMLTLIDEYTRECWLLILPGK